MDKNSIAALFPESLGQENELIKNLKHYEGEMKKIKEDHLASKNRIEEYFKNKILEKVTDPVFKKILLQPIARSENNVIESLITSYMDYNGTTRYTEGILFTQIHLMSTFDGIEDFFGKRFHIKEFKAEIWCRQRPHDEENVILNVDRIKEDPIEE